MNEGESEAIARFVERSASLVGRDATAPLEDQLLEILIRRHGPSNGIALDLVAQGRARGGLVAGRSLKYHAMEFPDWTRDPNIQVEDLVRSALERLPGRAVSVLFLTQPLSAARRPWEIAGLCERLLTDRAVVVLAMRQPDPGLNEGHWHATPRGLAALFPGSEVLEIGHYPEHSPAPPTRRYAYVVVRLNRSANANVDK